MTIDTWELIQVFIGMLVGLGVGHWIVTLIWNWAFNSLEDDIKHWL